MRSSQALDVGRSLGQGLAIVDSAVRGYHLYKDVSFCHYVAKKKKGRLQVCIRKRHKSCPTILYPQVLQSNLYGKTCKGHIRVDMTYLGHTCLVASRIKLRHNVVNKMNLIENFSETQS